MTVRSLRTIPTMRYVFALALALALAACGAPNAIPPSPCSPACSPGQACIAGRCFVEVDADAGPGDAAVGDAPIDTPPNDAPADATAPDAAVGDIGVDTPPADVQRADVGCGFCGGDRYCYMGRCVRTCATPAGTPTAADCDGNDANGCETPVNTSSNCGVCGVVCRAPLECFPIRGEGMVITGYMCR